MGRPVAVLFTVLFAVAAVAAACGDDGGTDTGTEDPAVESDGALADVVELADMGADHNSCAPEEGCNVYDRSPPASGSHFDAWQNCGFYTEPVQDQTAVHSLEHGAVWIAYRPDLDPTVLDAIRDRVAVERHALVAPYPGLDDPIVLTAWTRQLAVDDWSDPAVEQFLVTYLGDASPTAPEAGASCEGAVGSPPADSDANFDAILAEVT